MTAVATRVPCPADGCTYATDAASMPAHVAMAHPEAPATAVAPKRSARNGHTDAAPAAVPPSVGAPELRQLPLELVRIGPNVRVDIAELEELAASIREHGVLQPIKVTGPHPDGTYLVTWGQRRTLASQLAEQPTIPAIVTPADLDLDEKGATRSIEQLVENLHRADLNPIDRAEAMRAVVDSGVSQADLARKLGIAPSTVANDLRLLALDAAVLDCIRVGEITASHGKSLASLPPKHQTELAARIVHSKLSAHQIESELQWRRQAAESDARALERTEKQVPKLLDALRAASVSDATEVSLQAPYNMNRDRLQSELAAAGYRTTSKYVQERPAKGKCDCAAVRVEFNRAWKVIAGCVDDRHRDRARNLDQREENERRDAIAAKVDALATRIEPRLADADVAVLILVVGRSHVELSELIAGAGDPNRAELRRAAAKALARVADSSRAWGDRRAAADQALDDLLEMLPAVEAES